MSRPSVPEVYPDDAWEVLSKFLSDSRKLKMVDAAGRRTNRLRLVVQDIHNPHNVSACIRSADAFGVLNVDVVCLTEKFSPSTVTRGVDHWLRIKKHVSIDDCATELKKEGYAIACAYPHPDAVPLQGLPVDRPIAMVFGNEHNGVSPLWDQHADYRFTIPMFGMVESLNISVAAAIALYDYTLRARSAGASASFDLNEAEQKILLNEWVCKQFRSWQSMLRRAKQPSST
jgi:tRNA (guanosine-2'-O-)-methyltransferase